MISGLDANNLADSDTELAVSSDNVLVAKDCGTHIIDVVS
jgi:hypothetical protein